MKFSMCIDYTRKIFNFPLWEREETEGNRLPTLRTISKKISNVEANLEIFKIIVRITCIFAYLFSPFAHGAILEKNFV